MSRGQPPAGGDWPAPPPGCRCAPPPCRTLDRRPMAASRPPPTAHLPPAEAHASTPPLFFETFLGLVPFLFPFSFAFFLGRGFHRVSSGFIGFHRVHERGSVGGRPFPGRRLVVVAVVVVVVVVAVAVAVVEGIEKRMEVMGD